MNNLEDLKKMKVEPSSEVWNKVEKTLHRRMILRRSAIAAAVVAVAVPVVLLVADIAVPQINKSTNQQINKPQKETVVAQVAMSEEFTAGISDDSTIETTIPQGGISTVQNSVDQLSVSVPTSAEVEVVAKVNAEESKTPTSAATPHQQVNAVPQKNVQTVERPASADTKFNVENVPTSVSSEVASVREEKNVETIASKSPELPSESVLTIPNVILPNDDNAENRVFSVHSDSPLTAYRLFVYNRGGRLVFQTNDINNSWGCTHNGVAVQQGTYVYVIQYSDCNGKPFVKKGTVTVLR